MLRGPGVPPSLNLRRTAGSVGEGGRSQSTVGRIAENWMRRFLERATLAFVVVLIAAGCNRGGARTSDEPRVALVMKTLNHPFFLDMQRGAQDAARAAGVELVVQA